MPSMPPPGQTQRRNDPSFVYGAWRRCEDRKWRYRHVWHWFHKVLIVEVRDQRTYAQFEDGRPKTGHTWTEYRWRDATSMSDVFPPEDIA